MDTQDPRWESFPELQKKMGQLDMALTGNSFEKVSGQLHHYPSTVDSWLFGDDPERVWYLSDSGYSRVYFNDSVGKLDYTYNSLQKVKENWPKCIKLIVEIETWIREEINKLYIYRKD